MYTELYIWFTGKIEVQGPVPLYVSSKQDPVVLDAV